MPGSNPYRALPAVDELVDRTDSTLPRPLLVDLARIILDRARTAIGEGREFDPDAEIDALARAWERSAGVEVINATGVLLHTNLGRARWSKDAVDAAMRAAHSYSNVEIDLETGERSRRGAYVTRLLRTLTGAEDALVVNNNASALLLALSATSGGRAVPVSRGELIEIGGSYRLPAVMQVSGARLIEVGTTNRTRIGDFETAVQVQRCGSILKVHPSNFRIEGFASEASIPELATLAGRKGIPLIYDIGSGLLDSETPWLPGPTPGWLEGEPAARQALDQGADIVTFSGDKLLGGPQAGIIVGGQEEVERLRNHPLTRALRVDGVALAALTATLEAYARGEPESLPFWRQALAPPSEIARRAEEVARPLDVRTAPGKSAVGAGSVPGMSIPTTHVVLAGEDHLFPCLVSGDPPILARREQGSLLLDLRTVEPHSDAEIIDSVIRCR